MKKILVATDGSPGSAAAEAAAIDLCVEHGAELVVVHCWRAPGDWLGEPYYRHAVARELHAARGAVARALGFAETWRIPAEADLVDAPAAKGIVDAAAAHGVDLIVVGAHDHGSVERMFVGSVSAGVLRHAHAPVLVVKEGLMAPPRENPGDRPRAALSAVR